MANTTKKKSSSTRKITSTRRKVNSSIASSLSNASGVKKSTISKGITQVSKLSTGGKVAVALSLIGGIAIGYFGIRLVQKNDQFRLINGEEVNINQNEEYDVNNISNLVICVSYSRNVVSSVSVSIKDNEGNNVSSVDTSVVDKVYTLTFTSSDIKYRNITLTQTLRIVEQESSYDGE